MKSFFHFFLVGLFCLTASTSFAQTFGLRGGLNLANQLVKDDDETYSEDYKSQVGFHLGATVEFNLTDMNAFEPGLLLSTKVIGLKSLV